MNDKDVDRDMSEADDSINASENSISAPLEGIEYNVSELMEDGIFLSEVRRGRFSPVMMTEKQLDDAAYEAAAIIEKNARKPLLFSKIISSYSPEFIPDCDMDNNIMEVDTGTCSKQSGNMPAHVANDVINAKLHCQECPLARECLALSMTGIQITRVSRTERTLPRYPGDTESPPLVMDDFLIFGGCTPQERRIVFNKVCDILEENNKKIMQGRLAS